MDIAALSMSLSQTKLQQDSSLAVMKMVMNTTKTNSDGLTQMLSQTKGMFSRIWVETLILKHSNDD